MKIQITAALGAGLVLFLAGVLVGRWPPPKEGDAHGMSPVHGHGAETASLASEISRLKTALAGSHRESRALTRKIDELRRARVYERVAELTDLEEDDPESIDLNAFSLGDLLEARAEIGDDALDEAVIVDQELRRRMIEDPDSLAALLDEFRSSPDHHLAVLLGSFRSPEIETVATAMTAPHEAKESRLLALEVLDHLDHLSPAHHTQLLENMRSELDPEVLGAAIYALPHGVVKPGLRSETQSLLHSAAEHADAQIRARATLVMGMGLVGDEDVDVLLGRMLDPAVEVRSTSIAAVRNYRGEKCDAIVASLRDRMNDKTENFDVRKQAWKMLSMFPMDAITYRDWAELRHTIDGLGEAR